MARETTLVLVKPDGMRRGLAGEIVARLERRGLELRGARLLKIPKSTLYKLVREGSVPCQKIGKHWRFHKEAIDEWLAQQHNSERGESP